MFPRAVYYCAMFVSCTLIHALYLCPSHGDHLCALCIACCFRYNVRVLCALSLLVCCSILCAVLGGFPCSPVFCAFPCFELHTLSMLPVYCLLPCGISTVYYCMLCTVSAYPLCCVCTFSVPHLCIFCQCLCISVPCLCVFCAVSV